MYRPDGSLVGRFASGGVLDSPWGLALAPANFGPFSGDLLVGNTGNGHINAFDPRTGAFRGTIDNDSGDPITIPRLWGLTFGNGHVGGATDALFFTAGLDHEQHGLFGAIQYPRGGTVGPTSGDGIFDPNAPGEAKNYPLPPDAGPTFQGNTDHPSQPVVVLLPMTNTSVVLLPTLLPASQPTTRIENSVAVARAPVGPSNGGITPAITGPGVASIVLSAGDVPLGGSTASDSLSLNSFLDVNPSRHSPGDLAKKYLRETNLELPNDRVLAVWNPPARIPIRPNPARADQLNSRAESDTVVGSEGEGLTTLVSPGPGASTRTSAGEPDTMEVAGQGNAGSWWNKLPFAVSVLLLWNCFQWHRGKGKERAWKRIAQGLTETVSLSKCGVRRDRQEGVCWNSVKSGPMDRSSSDGFCP